MPYASEKQRRYLKAVKPDVAAKFDAHSKGKIKKVAYEDVVKSEDPTFNHKVAKGIFEAIMKMDDESARMYSYLLANDVVEETIEKNLPQLQHHLDEVIERRLAILKQATARAVVKTETGLSFATALVDISKAIDWDEKLHPRSQGGQFRTKITHAQTKPLNTKTAKAVGIRGTSSKEYEGLNSKQKAQYQDEYRQLSNFLAAVHASSVTPGDSDVILHFKSGSPHSERGEHWFESNNGTKVDRKLLNPKEHTLIGVEARPNTLTAGGAAFGLTRALGGQPGQGTVDRVNYLDTKFKPFAQEWTAEPEGKQYNENQRLYSRIESGAGLAYGLAPPGSKLAIAARTAQFAGSHGPEAEAVFGPSARKAAYRYRGVTRTPEADVVTAWNTAVQNSKMSNIPVNVSTMGMGFEREKAKLRAPTDSEKIEGRTQVIHWLRARQPNPKLFNLQLASGNTPPSQGILIDSKGKVVAQAVGYGDDHYLPFNLKQLGKLNGGEYIRSRSVGGITTEDIYAGLMTGADRVTVTSRSGVFSIQFQPDIKGRKRALNDKARRMTGRYAQLLDAVQSEQVDAMDVSPEIKAGIRAEVMDEMGDWGLRGSEINQEVQNRVKEFKENPEFSESDEKLISFMQRQDPRAMSMDAASLRTEIMSELAAEKEFKFRLNANGYKAAMDSLEEQFPYYIKSSVIPKREAEKIHTEIDRGYVAPGKNRPRAASAGLFGDLKTSYGMTAGGKYSAQEANYQRGLRGGTPPPSTPDSPEGGKPPSEAADEAAKVRRNIAGMRQNMAFAEAFAGIQQRVRDQGITEMTPDDHQIMAYTAEDLKEPSKQARAEVFVNRLRALGVNLGEAGTKYQIAAGHVSREPFEPGKAGLYPTKAFDFDEPGYRPGDTLAQRNAALAKIDKIAVGGVTTNRKYSEMHNGELAQEHGLLTRLKLHLDAGGEALSPGERVALIQREEPGITPTPRLGALMSNPAKINTQLEMVHRARAANLDVPEKERGIKVQEMPEGDIVITGALAPVEDRKAESDRVRRSVAGQIAQLERAMGYFANHGPNGEPLANALGEAIASLNDGVDDLQTDAAWEAWRTGVGKPAMDIMANSNSDEAFNRHVYPDMWVDIDRKRAQAELEEKIKERRANPPKLIPPLKGNGGGSILS